jgi:hypothetical protein
MEDSWQRRRMLLAKERHWIESYIPRPPEVRAADLIKGNHYAALTEHGEACRLLAGGMCSCRPHTRFFAEPVTRN